MAWSQEKHPSESPGSRVQQLLGGRLRLLPWDADTLAAAPADGRAWLMANAPTLVFVLALWGGILVRGYYAMRDAFPVNDGGLFYVMARDLQTNHYLIPDFTAYNGGEIPYVYSPLTLYLAALGDALTPASLMDMFWLLPLIGTALTIWAAARLTDAVFRDRWTVAAAAVAFAFTPRTFVWLIMGGGLPRSFGLAFALLTMREGYLLVTEGFTWRRAIITGVLAALTMLTHMETAAFLAFSMVLVALVRPKTGIASITVAGLIGLAISLPWLLGMVAIHGLGPFRTGMEEGGQLLDNGEIAADWILTFIRGPVWTSEPYYPLVGSLGLIGAIYACARGQWLIPVWWLVTGIIGMRAFPTYVTVATCIMAGVTVGQLIVPALQNHFAQQQRPLRAREIAAVTGAAVFCIWFTLVGAVTTDRGEIGNFLESLSPADRTAMEWVHENTPADAQFAVMPTQIWQGDYPVEWFPALADRVSVTTPQGYEWVADTFQDRVDVHNEFRNCTNSTYVCIERALRGTDATYIYLASDCCTVLKSSLRFSPNFDVLYDDDVLIAQWIGSESWPSSSGSDRSPGRNGSGIGGLTPARSGP